MLDFFDWISQFFQMVWDYFVKTLEAIYSAILIIGGALEAPLLAGGMMPTFIMQSFAIVILIFFINWLLSRN